MTPAVFPPARSLGFILASEAIYVLLGAVWEMLKNSGGNIPRCPTSLAKSKSSRRFSLLHVFMLSLFLLPQVTTSCQTSTNHELVSMETHLLLCWEYVPFFLLLGRLSWKTKALRSSDAAFDPYVMDAIVHCLTGAEQLKSNVVFTARRLRLPKKSPISVLCCTLFVTEPLSHGRLCHFPFNELVWEVRFPPRKTAHWANCMKIFPWFNRFILPALKERSSPISR